MSYLILVRHGQSVWNLENRFTGWVDVMLSSQGLNEAKDAGLKIKEFLKNQESNSQNNIQINKIYVSHLMRSIQTMHTILDSMDEKRTRITYHDTVSIHDREHFTNILDHTATNNAHNTTTDNTSSNIILEIQSSPAIAERYYGDLQGLNKDDTRAKYGDEQVHIWRRSFDIAPPNGESLKDTLERVRPYYARTILNDLLDNKTVLVVAHGNSLRAMIKDIENIADDVIANLELPTGAPIIYTFNKESRTYEKMLF